MACFLLDALTGAENSVFLMSWPITGQELLCNSAWCSGALLDWHLQIVSKQLNPKEMSCGLNFNIETCGIFPFDWSA